MSDENDVAAEAENGPLNEVSADLEKAKKDYLYLMADFDNYRKNAIKERSDLVKYGTERFVRDLLGVLDNFERAMSSDANPEQFRQGIEMISQEIRGMLTKNGVSELPSEGLPFDPSSHEALSSEPTNSVPEGHVARVFKKAYKLHDRLVRPAQVVVATAVKEQSN